jgi:hypothetical protein
VEVGLHEHTGLKHFKELLQHRNHVISAIFERLYRLYFRFDQILKQVQFVVIWKFGDKLADGWKHTTANLLRVLKVVVEHIDEELAFLLLHFVYFYEVNHLLEAGAHSGPNVDQNVLVKNLIHIFEVLSPELGLVHLDGARHVVCPVVLDLVHVIRLVLHEAIVIQLVDEAVLKVAVLLRREYKFHVVVDLTSLRDEALHLLLTSAVQFWGYFQVDLVHNWSKLYQGLILDPSVRVLQASLEEFNTLRKFLKFCYFQVLYQICKIFDAHLSHSPNIIIIEILECIINFV